MVSRASWYKITLIGTILVVILSAHAVRGEQQISKPMVYSATNDQLDLLVSDGIGRADHSTVPLPIHTRAVIVPHHLLATEAVALGVKTLSLSRPDLVIILSPDHFHQCPTLLCTTTGSYDTFFGSVPVNTKEAAFVLSYTRSARDSRLFTQEHGVLNIVPFIKHYMPNATILPIALSQIGIGTPETRQELLSILETVFSRNNAGLIVSSDFSHYLPLPVSQRMDEQTQQTFCSEPSDQLLKLQNPSQSDCPLCLWAAKTVAQKLGFWNPGLLWHSNSAELAHELSAKQTTSHFTYSLGTTLPSTPCIEMKAQL